MSLDCTNCSKFTPMIGPFCFHLTGYMPNPECSLIPLRDRRSHSLISRSTYDEWKGYEEEFPSIDELKDWRIDKCRT